MKIWTRILATALVSVALPIAAYAASGDLSGSYKIVQGTNQGGGSYAGDVIIRKSGDVYQLSWVLPGESYSGLGLLDGDVLSVGWVLSGQPGVVSYKVKGERLEGTWASTGSTKSGVEILEKKVEGH